MTALARRQYQPETTLPQPGERVKIDYPGYMHHGKTVVVLTCGRDKCDTAVRQRYSDLIGAPLVTFCADPSLPNVVTGLPLNRVHRV